MKSSVMGNQLFLIISGAWPLLGPWQAVYFCEFDGPHERRYYVKIVEN
ncbi:MAG: YjbQ family protein [Oscillospiraceae bacterium]|nr:YjbQ family protein [Oscillospiraceae bacterium]